MASDEWIENKMRDKLAEAYEQEYLVRDGLKNPSRPIEVDVETLFTQYQEEQQVMEDVIEEVEDNYPSVEKAFHDATTVEHFSHD